MRWCILLCLLLGCAGTDGSSCTQAEVWYPDDDKDGVGEPTASYFGCQPPAGWVNSLSQAEDTGADSGGTGTRTQTTGTSP